MKMKTYLTACTTALVVSAVVAGTNMVPLEINRQIEPGVTDITKQIAPLVCDGITVSLVKHDIRPTYRDGPTQITGYLKLDASGAYSICFVRPDGTNHPAISLAVAPPSAIATTNTLSVNFGCPTAITNHQNDTLILEWRGGGNWNRLKGWDLLGIKKKE